MYRVPIFLADADSTDRTRDTAELLASRLNFLDFHIIKGGLPAFGRNLGAQIAPTRYVLFMDADIEIRDETLIERCVQEMRARGLHCVTTDIFSPRADWRSRLAYHTVNFYQRGSRFVGTPFSTGMFMMFDRAIFHQLGGFNEKALFAEDFMLSKKVRGSKFRVIPGGIETSDRRFQKMGYWKLAKLFFGTALFSWRDEQFTKDHGYWKH